MKNKILLPLCFISVLLMMFIGLSLQKLTAPVSVQSATKINVFYGDSIYQIARKMKEDKLFEYPLLIVWYARILDIADKIKVGEYAVTEDDSALTILDKIVKGKVIQYKITLIEGWTAKRAISAIQASEGIVTTLDSDSVLPFLRSIKGFKGYNNIEGLIFPATYHYPRGTKDSEILRRSLVKMRHELNRLWLTRHKDLPYKKKYDALIMASIIEKETGLDNERRQIAGVFVRRLKKNMRLQTDPTVIYGMGENYKGKITYSDLRTKTAYNTYQIKGLPPTPIALPGASSLSAALKPIDNGMLYFVAKGDGGHEFSKTFDQHQSAVKKYQLKRKSDYRSTPK